MYLLIIDKYFKFIKPNIVYGVTNWFWKFSLWAIHGARAGPGARGRRAPWVTVPPRVTCPRGSRAPTARAAPRTSRRRRIAAVAFSSYKVRHVLIRVSEDCERRSRPRDFRTNDLVNRHVQFCIERFIVVLNEMVGSRGAHCHRYCAPPLYYKQTIIQSCK